MQMHGHFKTETNNTSCKGNTALWQLPRRKIRKFIKSKFKILTCVVLLGRLNTMRGISAGKYDKGNKSIIMSGIWVGKIYIAINYCLSLALPCYSENHNQLLKHLLFAFKIFFDQIFVHFCFMGGFNRRCSYDQGVSVKRGRIPADGGCGWKNADSKRRIEKKVGLKNCSGEWQQPKLSLIWTNKLRY